MSLISTEDLASAPPGEWILVDASYFLANQGKSGSQVYRDGHIPGAIFFDIDAIADSRSPLPHMLPDEELFAQSVGDLGIGNQDKILIYDQSPLRSAARAWWSFKVFGAADVAILDGGMQKWQKEGRPTAQGVEQGRTPKVFQAKRSEYGLKNRDAVAAAISSKDIQIVDARSRGRFRGTDPEPRPGLRQGHIPGAKNLPFTELFQPDSALYLSIPELKEKFRQADIDLERPIIAHCGSGITACPVLFAAHLCGARQLALYDGSWAEWGSAQDTPIVQE